MEGKVWSGKISAGLSRLGSAGAAPGVFGSSQFGVSIPIPVTPGREWERGRGWGAQGVWGHRSHRVQRGIFGVLRDTGRRECHRSRGESGTARCRHPGEPPRVSLVEGHPPHAQSARGRAHACSHACSSACASGNTALPYLQMPLRAAGTVIFRMRIYTANYPVP